MGASGNRGDGVTRTGGGTQGTGPAVRIAPTVGGPAASIQQADSDGYESSYYWPESELNVMYRLATTSQYIAMACPTQTTGTIDSAGTTLDCTGVGGAGYPGKARDTAMAAADLVRSLDGSRFYLYAEDQATNDEANVLGPKQARLFTPNPPTWVVGPEESPYVSAGTWVSEVVDTSCYPLFDTIAWNPAGQPAGTTLTFQVATADVATGPFTFLGPDGTPGTFYTTAAGQPINGVHDGHRYAQIAAALATTDIVRTPTVDDLTLTWSGAVTIAGTLFNDIDGNGVDDGGDLGLDAVPVALWLDNGDATFDSGTDTLVSNTTTSLGAYAFANQPPGTYFVVPDEAALDTAHLIGATTPSPAGPIVAADCDSPTVDIGWQIGANTSVTVFADQNSDGLFGGGETGVADGVRVGLWRDDGDGLFDRTLDTLVQLVVSDATGTSSFATVPAGGYFAYVAPGDEPTGYFPTASTDNPIGLLTLVSGSDTSVDIGFVPEGSITGEARDLAGSPKLPGVFVSLYRDDGDGVFDPMIDTFVTATVTDAAASYTFAGVAAADYWVVPGPPPSGYLTLAPRATAVATGQDVVVDLPFAVASSVAGRVIADDDGVVDAETMPLAGITLTLFLDDGDGVFSPGPDTQVASMVSGADGRFEFGGLPDGQYFVQLDAGSGLFAEIAVLSSPNTVGPVAADTADVLFVFEPLNLLLPETGSSSGLLVRLATLLIAAGFGLVVSSRWRRRVLG